MWNDYCHQGGQMEKSFEMTAIAFNFTENMHFDFYKRLIFNPTNVHDYDDDILNTYDHFFIDCLATSIPSS